RFLTGHQPLRGRFDTLRRLRTAHCGEDLHHLERVLCDPGGRARLPAWTQCAQPNLCDNCHGDPSSAEPARQDHLDGRTARDQPPGPVPVCDLELQPCSEHRDRRRGDGDPKTAADLHLPPSIATSFQGSAQAFQSSLSSTPVLILAGLVAVYIILGMLYESTIHPITIISTLPSAGLGALLTLMLFGMTLDVIGIIGIILLIGIVKKNGIMLVDFALVGERERGLSTEEAIHEACLLRFRPI